MNRAVRRLLRLLVPSSLRRCLSDHFSHAPKISSIAGRVREARLTYLSTGKLAQIEGALEDISRSGIPGSFLECGIALGGSAIVIATLMPKGREFHGYDVFGMIPPPTSEKDDDKSKIRYKLIKGGRSKGIGGDTYYGYIDNLYERVENNFSRFSIAVDNRRVSLHKGFFYDTLHPPREVAFAHIDCDWYEPVKLCLERIYPRLSVGGYVVLDDYNDYSGCRQATDEFVAGKAEVEIVATEPNFILRRKS